MSSLLKAIIIIGILTCPLWLQPVAHIWTYNVSDIKEHHAERLTELGMKEIAYEGYQWGIFGGKVWYTVENPAIPSERFSIFLIKRGGEYHQYGSYPTGVAGVINLQN